GKLDDPEIQDAVNRIITEGCAAGKVVGVGAVNADRPEQIREFMQQGARFFCLNTTSILRSAARNILQNLGINVR
ncbi:MAG: hypothetical protein V3W44_04765, partial [Dehalococcoidales bacterium]